MLRRLHEIAPDDPDVGGKALGLARLAAAGLPVPETLVLPASAAHAPWPEVAAALEAALTELPVPIVVRSSASAEDRAAAAAPGLFLSVAGVASRSALHRAVHAVWASRGSPVVLEYLRRRGLDARDVTMAIVLQPELPGHAAGTVYTRRPGEPDEMMIDLGGAPALLTREGVALTPLPRPLDDASAREIARLALAAERAIGAEETGADIELVLTRTGTWLVQARPIVVAPGGARARRVTYDFSAEEPELVWRWDATHNPAPLSPAQAGLVELVDAAGVAPYRQRVVDGYLFFAEGGARPSGGGDDDEPATLREVVDGAEAAPAAEAAAARAADARPLTPAELRHRYDHELRPALEATLAPAEAEAVPSLETALTAYLDFYAGYARLAPTIRRARDALLDWLTARVGQRAPRVAAEWLGAVGATSPQARVPLAWDVASADVEIPVTPPAEPSAPRSTAGPPPELDVTIPAELVIQAHDAAAIAEEDDALFARAQALVRRATQALAARWQVDADDLLHLPLDDLRAAARADHPPADLGARAAAARGLRARQRAALPPLVIAAGRAVAASSGRLDADPGLLRGWGSGGRARGRVYRLNAAASSAQASEIAAPAGSIVVAETILPGMAVLLRGAAAIVAEHGGPLGHGAAVARELGLPAVVGCTGASSLGDGDEVLVDGAAGLVLKI